MRIAMLGHRHIPSREGGVEVVVGELATRMAKKGHKVTCYNRHGKHALKNEKSVQSLKEYEGVRIKEVFTIDKKGLGAATSSFFGTIKVLFSNNEVVHYHAEGPCAWLWIIKWFSRKRVVATIHGLNWQSPKWKGFGAKFIKFGERIAVKYADEIIVLNKETQEYFQKKYNRSTIFIPNGVNAPTIVEPNIITQKWNLHKDDYILYLGRIEPVKGIHYLIEAFKSLNTTKKLVIAGGVSEVSQYYDTLKELSDCEKSIIYTGYVDGSILKELYSNAYVYVLPSDSEGMPLSLLEALSYKNCCVTSDIRACTEVLDSKGFTFRKSDVEDLKNVLNELLNNSEIVKKYKEEAQKYVIEKYNWNDIVDNTVEVYKGSR